MRLLLDTCTFLWLVDSPEKLSTAAREAIVDPANEVFVSAISAWEIQVKVSLGKLSLSEPPAQFVPKQREAHGLAALALREAEVFQLPKLPSAHHDPFDRILICQAIEQALSIVTPDPLITQYPVRTIW